MLHFILYSVALRCVAFFQAGSFSYSSRQSIVVLPLCVPACFLAWAVPLLFPGLWSCFIHPAHRLRHLVFPS
jgi:hypothetical protein